MSYEEEMENVQAKLPNQTRKGKQIRFYPKYSPIKLEKQMITQIVK